MTQRYWVIGGEYRDCEFAQLVPGTEQIHGPFGDEGKARREWTRLTFRDQCPATRRYAIASEPMAR
ncbi:hypothetical protein H9L12_11840 [Sphingomonas rhizophila]|uniref:DUF4170 domain-containing protein n=1 Tax=Sphingomonas rhizophila TaxID=2071607 RepID=A0A7G9SAM5_9SPHN|nr:hypothetical protein [Sphingomonas rhizophila]QNN64900.1 hypothetical protein H9L12_11840 [Sphingomonas rhizophila]